MRGQYVPLAYEPAGTSVDAREEIRCAIDSVKFADRQSSVEPDQPSSLQQDARSRDEWLAVPRIAVVGAIDRVDGSVITPIKGYVPVAFFRWFDELKSRLEDQQVMLERCRFEEVGWQ